MTDRYIYITERIPTRHKAVVWDGTVEAWDAILDMERGDCWLDPGRPGLIFRYGHGETIPIGNYVMESDEPSPITHVSPELWHAAPTR